MIRHIFMASIKTEVTEKQKQSILENYLSLEEKISVIKDLTVAENIGLYDDSIDIVLEADFKDKDDWQVFMNNPEHARAGEWAYDFFDPSSIVVVQLAI